jgi:parvulin-like peptidyl-prolyl isomerase
LAAEVFTDPKLSSSGGSLGSFSFDEMDPAFEDAAYTLDVGEVSHPVRTAHGYSIIRLDDRKVNPLLTENEYATKKDRMYNYVLHRRQSSARKASASQLLEELEVEYHEGGVAVVEGYLLGSVVLSDETNPLPATLAEPFVSFGTGANRVTWSVGAFREQAEKTSVEQRAAVRSSESLRQLTEGLVVRHEMIRRAKVRGWHHDPSYLRAVGQSTDKALYDVAYYRLSEGVAVPDDSLRAYYERHRAELVRPATVRIREVLVASNADAVLALDEIPVLGFEAVATARTMRPGADKTGGLLGDLEKSQLGMLGDRLFSVPVGEVVGPIEVAGRYAVFRIDGRTPARTAELGEVAKDLESALRRNYVRPFLREHVATLREGADIYIDEQLLFSIQLKRTT